MNTGYTSNEIIRAFITSRQPIIIETVLQQNGIRKSRAEGTKSAEYISDSFPSPLDRQCCLCSRWSEERRKEDEEEGRLTSSELVCRHCGGSRDRSRVTALRRWAFDDEDDKDDTDESSQ